MNLFEKLFHKPPRSDHELSEVVAPKTVNDDLVTSFFVASEAACAGYENKISTLENSLQQHANAFCEFLGIDICFIGFIRDGAVFKKGFATSMNLSKAARDKITAINDKDDLDESILKHSSDHNVILSWNNNGSTSLEQYIFSLLPDADTMMNRIKMIDSSDLPNGDINYFCSLPLKSADQLIGYLQLVSCNSIVPFSQLDNIAKVLAHRLALLYERKIRYGYDDQISDQLHFRKMKDYGNIDQLLDDILSYLHRVYEVEVACLWTLANHGDTSDPDLVVLRHYYLPEKSYRYIKEIKAASSFEANDSLNGNFIQGKLNSQSSEFNCLVYDLNNKDNPVKSQYKFLEGNIWIGIPIKMNNPPSEDDADQCWGTISLRVSEDSHIKKIAEVDIDRLENLATLISNIIDHEVYKRRYTKIHELNKNLLVPVEDNDSRFYSNIAHALKAALDASECSIFLLHEVSEGLYMKASTADSLIDYTDTSGPISRDKNQLIELKTVLYGLDPINSYTARVYRSGLALHIYNIWHPRNQEKLNTSCIEGFKAENESLIMVPLMDKNKNPYGVIRCINKDGGHAKSIQAFSKFDLSFLEFIIGNISLLIQQQRQHKQFINFYRDFAHETKGPLHYLRFELDMMEFNMRQRGYISNEINEQIKVLNRNINDIKNNVDITDFAIRGNLTLAGSLKRTRIALRKILDKSIDPYETAGFKFTRQIRSFVLDVDPKSFESVIFNLITNAIRYSLPPRRPIIITAKKVSRGQPEWANGLVIEISNYGIGIDKNEVEKILTVPGYRAERAKQLVPSGSGMGLKFCNEIIRKHGGMLKISSLDKPTTFSVFLPSNCIIQE